MKLFWLLFSISNTQTWGFYYNFIWDNDFTVLEEPYVSAISRKILSAGRLTAEVSWWCFLTFSAHINVANSDIPNKNRFLAVCSLMVIKFNSLFFFFFLTAYQLAVKSNRVKQCFAAHSRNREKTPVLNQNQNKAKKHFGKIAITSLGSDKYLT